MPALCSPDGYGVKSTRAVAGGAIRSRVKSAKRHGVEFTHSADYAVLTALLSDTINCLPPFLMTCFSASWLYSRKLLID